ncbi:MAG: ClpXP protease specificity-enhancing factor SspB [Ideonella sp.]|nr:ClpXP protease specificity-enhancing factor SspB [Ideonella sp.]
MHDWCTDNGFTPYIAVYVDRTVQVPMEYVKANEIVLNVGFEATSGLSLGNETIEFKARFGGTARDIVVPVDHVIAIYARENGQGMAFPVPAGAATGGMPPMPVAQGTAGAATRASGPDLRLAPVEPQGAPEAAASPDTDGPDPDPGSSPGGRPALKRVK